MPFKGRDDGAFEIEIVPWLVVEVGGTLDFQSQNPSGKQLRVALPCGEALNMTDHQHHIHIVPRRTYFMVFVALLVLMFATIAAAYVDLGGWFNIILALTIASLKALLIITSATAAKSCAFLWWAASSGCSSSSSLP